MDAFLIDVFLTQSAVAAAIKNFKAQSECPRKSEFFILHHRVFVFGNAVQPGTRCVSQAAEQASVVWVGLGFFECFPDAPELIINKKVREKFLNLVRFLFLSCFVNDFFGFNCGYNIWNE